MRNKLRGLTPLIFFGALLLSVDMPYRFARRCWSRIFHRTDAARWRSETIWQFQMARFFHRTLFPLMGIQIPIVVHGEIPMGQQCIIASNQCTAIDHLVLGMVTASWGCTAR